MQWVLRTYKPAEYTYQLD